MAQISPITSLCQFHLRQDRWFCIRQRRRRNSQDQRIRLLWHDRDPGTSGSLFGIGGAAESRGITPPLEDTVIFTLNGTAASKFNPHWRGRPDGSPRLYGTPELQLLFNIFTNPEGERFNVYGDAVPVRTIKYDGSGTLFTAGSSAEVVGFNPDIETRAFKFSGEPIVRIRVILFGGGSMFGFGSGAESTTIAVPLITSVPEPS